VNLSGLFEQEDDSWYFFCTDVSGNITPVFLPNILSTIWQAEVMFIGV